MSERNSITPEQAIEIVAETFGCEPDYMSNTSHKLSYVLTRTAICNMLRSEFGLFPTKTSKVTGWHLSKIREGLRRHSLYLRQFEDEYAERYREAIKRIHEIGRGTATRHTEGELNTEQKIMNKIIHEFGVSREQLKAAFRRGSIDMARAAYVHLLKTQLGMSRYEIGDKIGRSATTAARIMEDHSIFYKMDEEYRMKFDRIFGTTTLECVLVVEEQAPNNNKNNYSRSIMGKRVMNKMVNHLVKEGMLTTESKLDKDGMTTYTTRLNIPKKWIK